jgi:hypothetical protein
VVVTSTELLNIQSKPRKRRYRDLVRHPFEYRHNVCVPLSFEAVDRLGIVPGLDEVIEEIVGNRIILRFRRKEAL